MAGSPDDTECPRFAADRPNQQLQNLASRAVLIWGLGVSVLRRFDSKVSFVDFVTTEALMSEDLRALLTGGAFVVSLRRSEGLRAASCDHSETDAKLAPAGAGEVRPFLCASGAKSSDSQVASSAPLQMRPCPLLLTTGRAWAPEQKIPAIRRREMATA